MFLSPTAQAFQPALEFAIFNDGVPSSVFYGSHPEHDVIHHIPDEAIDELFPPTAEEVAEMDAADDFVETMAWLEYLDECEEEARNSFAGYKKRWSTRRADGLVGKPHPPKTTTRDNRDGHDGEGGSGPTLAGSPNGETIMVVPYVKTNFEIRPRKVEGRMMYGAGGAGRSCVAKNAKAGLHGHRGLIQQPRKTY